VAELVVKNLTVEFDKVKALDNVSFNLDSPFFAVIMGPNGAGKTTLLKSIIGLVKPSSGRISVYGLNPFRETGKVRQIIGYAPQIVHINIHVPMMVKEVVAMGLLSSHLPPRIIERKVWSKVDEALRMVELEGYSEKWFTELSGGERQRVLIARALIKNARLLILDEPFSMLDFEAKCEIAKLIQRLHFKMGVDVLMVAHEVSPCIAYDPLIILLNKKIYAIGKSTDVLRFEILKKAYPGVTEFPQGFIIGEDHA